MAAAKRKSPVHSQASLRHLWLAGLGLAVVAGREAQAARGRAVAQVGELQRRVSGLAEEAKANVREGLDNVRGQVEPKVVQFSAEVEARLAPVLDKLGLKRDRRPAKAGKAAGGRRKAAKPSAARKPQARRAPAKKRAVRRA